MHIINTTWSHYRKKRVVGKKFLIRHPFKWVLPDDDHHPYYYAGMSMKVEAPAVRLEEPET